VWTEEDEFAGGSLSELVEGIAARSVDGGASGMSGVSGVPAADGPSTFVTTSPDWWGGERTFGGMVVAQALSAAAQTVAEDLDVHSLHGYFLRPSKPGTLSTHKVQPLRDGRSFSMREVVSEVEGRETFRMACSFHRAEDGDEYQLAMADDIPGPDAVVVGDATASSSATSLSPPPSQAPPPPSQPSPFDIRDLRSTERRPDGTYLSTRRCWVRTRQRLSDDPVIHACILAYLSDMTGAAFRPLSLDSWGGYTDASLDHAVWFHRPRRADEWNLFDFQALLNASGRSTIRATMYGDDGVLYLSMAQELLIRKL
jgi:acyl-CoA thioesterase II